jgi:arabinose-5-phosphate isomerase
VVAAESRAIGAVALGDGFARAVEWILRCKGRVVVTGMGKPGFVAQKISATLASTGTPSLFVHPAEAAHGDLGRIARDDVVLALSNSGETEEILRLLPALRRIGARIVALTRDETTSLARSADLVVPIGNVEEACPMGLAPTASTSVLLALGDAIAMTVLANRPFDREEYALYHPGGKLGRGLMKVGELMRQGLANPVVPQTAPLHEAVAVMTRTPGRPGATSVVDGHGKLVGIFTDGDLRRLVERGRTDFAGPVSEVMGRDPRTVRPEELVADAARVLRRFEVDQVPVVDGEGRPVGLLDVQDLLSAKIL